MTAGPRALHFVRKKNPISGATPSHLGRGIETRVRLGTLGFANEPDSTPANRRFRCTGRWNLLTLTSPNMLPMLRGTFSPSECSSLCGASRCCSSTSLSSTSRMIASDARVPRHVQQPAAKQLAADRSPRLGVVQPAVGRRGDHAVRSRAPRKQ